MPTPYCQWNKRSFWMRCPATSNMSIPYTVSRLPPLPAVRDLLNLYRLQAVKQLSQNFLLEPKLTSKLVAAAGKINDGYVCEVGPGAGSLTRDILSRNVKQLIVIEKDKRFKPALELLVDASSSRMSIVWGDVLSHNLAKSFPNEAGRSWDDHPPNVHILGNLPFNISTPLIIRLVFTLYFWLLGKFELNSSHICDV